MKNFLFSITIITLVFFATNEEVKAQEQEPFIVSTSELEPIPKMQTRATMNFQNLNTSLMSLTNTEPFVDVLIFEDDLNIFDGNFIYKEYAEFDQFERMFKSSAYYQVKTVIYTSFRNDFSEVITEKQFTAKRYPEGNHKFDYFTGIGLSCNAEYEVQILDENNQRIAFIQLIINNLKNPSCSSDTSGGEMGTDEPIETCDVCQAFKKLNEKLDIVISKIPKEPNFQEVAQIMTNTLVPTLVNDTKSMLENLIGTADLPQEPPKITEPPKTELPKVDLPQEPVLNDTGLKKSSVEDIKQAPALNYEEPPQEVQEGFNLQLDPLKNLENMGEPEIKKPNELNLDILGDIPKPNNNSNDEIGLPPTPNENIENAPIPNNNSNDEIGLPPTPNENIENAPIPQENDFKESLDYMKKPK